MSRKTIVLATLAIMVLMALAYTVSQFIGSSEINKSIAVLPFVNMSNDPEQEYVGDGLAEEIINVLTQINDLKVIARSSSFQFKGKNEDMRKIGEQLGVAHLLEGSVRKSNNKLRITAQLIETKTGSHLWSKVFEREAGEIFSVQDEIALAVASALKTTLSLDANAPREVWNEEAWKNYQMGRFYYDRAAKDDPAKALEYFTKATKQDSSHAVLWSYISACYQFLDQWKEAIYCNNIALAIDPNSDDAVTNEFLPLLENYQHQKANALIPKAEELAKSPRSLRTLGLAMALMGRAKDGIPYLRKASELDPLQPLTFEFLAQAYFFAEDYDSAIFYAKRGLELSPALQSAFGSSLVGPYIAQNRWDELDRLMPELDEPMRLFVSCIKNFAINKQQSLKDLQALREMADSSSNNSMTALLYAYRGEKRQALEELKIAFREREPPLSFLIKSDPFFKGLREEEDFKAIIRKVDQIE